MTDFIKPVTMILTLQTLHHLRRRQLSVGLIACFSLDAPALDTLLTESASHAAWARLAGTFLPIDAGIPKAQHILVHNGYALAPASSLGTREPPYLIGTETIHLESGLAKQPAIETRLPGIRAQCVIEWRAPYEDRLRKLEPQIESLRLCPRLGCAWLLFRAVTPLPGADIHDIVRIHAKWTAMSESGPTAASKRRPPAGARRHGNAEHLTTTEGEDARQDLAGRVCIK